jgi:hypothetical protein
MFGSSRDLQKLGGNADSFENKGVVKIATQKLMKLRE